MKAKHQGISKINTQQKVQIKNPCDEQFEAMQHVDPSCRFCTQCAAKVYDFSNCTEEEFLAIFKANSGTICGRVRSKKTTFSPIFTQKKGFFSKSAAWFFSFIAFLGIAVSSCKSDEEHHVMGMMEPIENFEGNEFIDSTETFSIPTDPEENDKDIE